MVLSLMLYFTIARMPYCHATIYFISLSDPNKWTSWFTCFVTNWKDSFYFIVVQNMGTWEGEVNIGVLSRAALAWVGTQIHSNQFEHNLVVVSRFDWSTVANGHHTIADRATRMTDTPAYLCYQENQPTGIYALAYVITNTFLSHVHHFTRKFIKCSSMSHPKSGSELGMLPKVKSNSFHTICHSSQLQTEWWP